MKRLLALLCTLFSALALPGCDYVAQKELKPGLSTAREVRERMGPPNQEWPNEDGSVTWEYSRQPQGVECFMVTLGPDKILRSIEQVLTEANFARIEAGMTKPEVQRRLGKPGKTESFQLKQEQVWSWLIDQRMPGQRLYFTVTFNADGRVVRSGPFTEQYN